jgi:alkyldihydroxyacetonephosphate synthase
MKIDAVSLLVEVDARDTFDHVEGTLRDDGFTLGVAQTGPIGAWLEAGAPGAPSMFADPADHLVAGLEATLLGGATLDVRPGPRRAVGPDLVALLVGGGRRFGRIERAWLRIHRLEARRPAFPLPGVDLDPPLDDAETRLVDAIAASLTLDDS